MKAPNNKKNPWKQKKKPNQQTKKPQTKPVEKEHSNFYDF